MAIIKQDYGTLGGGTINPTLVNEGYTVHGGTTTQPIDINKSYILTISSNASADANFMIVFRIVKGVSERLDTAELSQTISIANGILSFTNPSTSYTRSYALTQID